MENKGQTTVAGNQRWPPGLEDPGHTFAWKVPWEDFREPSWNWSRWPQLMDLFGYLYGPDHLHPFQISRLGEGIALVTVPCALSLLPVQDGR